MVTTPTQIKRLEQYRDRWSSYGASTGILELSEKLSPNELKKYAPFKDYDDKFLERISTDISVAKWKKDAIIFEEGSYLDLAFFVVKGSVEVYLSKVQTDTQLGSPRFDSHRTQVFSEAQTQARDREKVSLSDTVFHTQIKKQGKQQADLVFLSVMDFNIPIGDKVTLGPGEIFGEIGALSGWPQSVTARTVSDCEIVQVRVPALRLMRRKSTAFKDRIDKAYRDRSLFAQLKLTPLFRNCEDSFISALKEKVELLSCEPDQIIVHESDSSDALYIVRSGFVKLSQAIGDNQIVVSYLSKGMTLGEVELLIQDLDGCYLTASSVEFSELIKINYDDMKQVMQQFPGIERQLWQAAIARIKETGSNKKNIGQSEFIEFALEKGLVQGNSILVIDTNICTRCDDCMKGCADTHGGLPRFVREGEKYDNLLITRACYHCRDPVCLVGCPTGAIHRTNVGDVVAIDEKLCIGCQSCANNCPYDAITMFDTGEVWPGDMVPQGLRGTKRLLATKCDLCYDTGHGPACVSNCPHGCAFRVGSIEEFQQLLSTNESAR
ncbi:cyclic nucleotide-binding domain-containing protein [candidate division KSB1 bacterium]|nr:cyclic nucleotide-binding domain-containing protein [candidate division KSB1 bacterium]